MRSTRRALEEGTIKREEIRLKPCTVLGWDGWLALFIAKKALVGQNFFSLKWHFNANFRAKNGSVN
jgi:hypothetical protein